MIPVKISFGTHHMRFFIVLIFSLFSSMAWAQELESSEISFEGESWLLEKFGEAGQKEFMGRQSMFLERAQLKLSGRDFSKGVIEFDLATEKASGFVGVNFRDNSEGSSEQFYVRFHQSGRPDSTQYLARLNSLASWQIHAGPNDAAAVELGAMQWIPIRIVVEGDRADIFVRDMETPLLHIAHLRTPNDSGGVTFYAFDRPEVISGAYFSRLKVRPLADGEGVRGTPKEEPLVAETVFKEWQISAPISESIISEGFVLQDELMGSLEWTEVAVEENGILNISRYHRKTDEADTVLVRLQLATDSPTTRLLRFGYSDRVRIYVNGKQQFFGNAQWRSRDHRFLGTIGLHDAVPLHLDAGENEIIAAVSESFGGWGFVGQLEDREGLKIR
jgi:hypothetical protein